MSYLRYKPGTDRAIRFPRVRYPLRRDIPREQAEHMRLAMPDPDLFEIVEED